MKHVKILLAALLAFTITGCLVSQQTVSADPELADISSGSMDSTTQNDESTSETGSGDEAGGDASQQEASIDIPVPDILAYPGREYLYVSNTSGESWDRLDIKPQISDSTYITAAAINPNDPQNIIVGTSYYGMFISTDGGANWSDADPNADLDLIYQGGGFYQEIASLFFLDSSAVILRTGFDGLVYRMNLETRSLEEISTEELKNISLSLADEAQLHIFEATIASDNSWPDRYPIPPTLQQDNNLPSDFAKDAAWQTRHETASNKVGIYLNSYQASANLDSHIAFMQENGINSVVVDFKDDQGLLRYDSNLEVALNAGTVYPRYNAENLISRLHEAGIYVIARVVVFKDRGLYRFDNGRYALWDRRFNEPWGVYRTTTPEATEDNPDPQPVTEQIEYWVDPYSDFVRSYNIAIARELESLGVDEIQFDYIRFPSDGYTHNIESRFLGDENSAGINIDKNSERVKILGQFLSEARRAISIPIGTDVFGFNGWARMSYLGQDIEVISHYVDVISPMSYPSHYSSNFLPGTPYFDKAGIIYGEGTSRAREITDDRAIIRQYVQAFLIGGELRYEEDRYFEYLRVQIRALQAAGGNGFTMWNNSGRYYMVNPEEFPEILSPLE